MTIKEKIGYGALLLTFAGGILAVAFGPLFIESNSGPTVQQYYKGSYLITKVYYITDFPIREFSDSITSTTCDSLKLIRYQEGILLIEKYRSMDSIAKMSKDNYKLLLPSVNVDTDSLMLLRSVIYEGIWHNEAIDSIILNLSDTIKPCCCNNGLRLIEKYRSIDSVAEAKINLQY